MWSIGPNSTNTKIYFRITRNWNLGILECRMFAYSPSLSENTQQYTCSLSIIMNTYFVWLLCKSFTRNKKKILCEEEYGGSSTLMKMDWHRMRRRNSLLKRLPSNNTWFTEEKPVLLCKLTRQIFHLVHFFIIIYA